MKQRLFAVLLTALAIFGMTSIANAANTSAAVNMRTGPSTHYRVMHTLPRGTHVRVLHCSGSWCKVLSYGHRGWVSKRYISHGKRRHHKTRRKQHSHGHRHHHHSYGHSHHSHRARHGYRPIVAGGILLYLLHRNR